MASNLARPPPLRGLEGLHLSEGWKAGKKPAQELAGQKPGEAAAQEQENSFLRLCSGAAAGRVQQCSPVLVQWAGLHTLQEVLQVLQEVAGGQEV